MTILFYEPSFVPVSGSAGVYPGAKLYFYETGTSTAQNSYTDSALSVAHANPVIADSNGRFAPIYLDESLEDYKVVLKDSSDVTLYTIDPFFNRYNAASDVPRGYDTLAAAVADVANIVAGDVLILKERISGSGGGAVWDAISYTGTENGYNTVDGGDSTTSFQLRQSGKDPINLNQWGLIPDDDASATAVINYNILRAAHTYAISQNDQTPPSTDLSDPNLGNINITCNAGIFYVKGKSAFALTSAEVVALGEATYRRGISYRGAGRHLTVFVFLSTGDAEGTWVSNSGTSSTYDHVQIKDMTLRSADWAFASVANSRRYKVVTTATINGFWLEGSGWEKMFIFDSVEFEGFDTAFKFRGTANVDQHTFTACRFHGIVDKVFDIDNDQSVANRMFGVDVQTYGDVFYVGKKGGGDFLWVGGSVHQDSIYDTGNLTDATEAAATPRALLHFNQEDVSTGVASNYPNSNYHFQNLRIENYDKYNHLVLAERDNVTAYGQGFATFTNCDFSVNFELADGLTSTAGGTNRASGSNERDLVFINKMAMDISFQRCYFASHQLFQITDVGDTTAKSASANITIRDSILGWDTSSAGAGLGPLSNKVTSTITSADRCNTNFISEGNYAVSVSATDSLSAEDFAFTGSASGSNQDELKWVNLKRKETLWPSTTGSSPRLYLPPGSIVASVFVYKPAGTVIGSPGSASFQIKIKTQADATLWSSTAHQEEDEHFEKGDVDVLAVVPAVPNNWIKLEGLNGVTANVTQSTSGQCLIGYFTGAT